MLLLILGFLLKIIGIMLAIPQAVSKYKVWKARRVADLYDHQYIYVNQGRKMRLSRWKKVLYRVTKMPLPHLWR